VPFQVAGVASSEYGAAQMLLAAVSMGQDFNYTITTNTTIGVMAALTVLTGLVNSLSTYWMEKMTKTYVIFHVLVLVSCSIALLVMTKPKHDAHYVFTDVDSTSGWSPIGFSFLFGFLSVSWTMTDYDATAHITEEISEPEIKAPWAISLAMLFTYLAGFLFNIVLCFCMGNPADILASPLAQPVAQIFYNSLGKGGGIFFTVAGFIIIKFVCFTAMVSLVNKLQTSLLLLTIFNSKHLVGLSSHFHVIVLSHSTISGPISTRRQELLYMLYGSPFSSALPST
jgi:amino acid transporter